MSRSRSDNDGFSITKAERNYSMGCNERLNFFSHTNQFFHCDAWHTTIKTEGGVTYSTGPGTRARANNQECEKIELAMKDIINECSNHFGYGLGKK